MALKQVVISSNNARTHLLTCPFLLYGQVIREVPVEKIVEKLVEVPVGPEWLLCANVGSMVPFELPEEVAPALVEPLENSLVRHQVMPMLHFPVLVSPISMDHAIDTVKAIYLHFQICFWASGTHRHQKFRKRN